MQGIDMLTTLYIDVGLIIEQYSNLLLAAFRISSKGRLQYASILAIIAIDFRSMFQQYYQELWVRCTTNMVEKWYKVMVLWIDFCSMGQQHFDHLDSTRNVFFPQVPVPGISRFVFVHTGVSQRDRLV